MGALVDAARDKRWLIAAASVIVTATCLLVPASPGFASVLGAGIVGAIAGTLLGPAVAAISLGMVGWDRFAKRAGRNEAMFHAGNAACNIAVLGASTSWGAGAVFFVLASTGLMSVAAALAIPKGSIDPDLARGLSRSAIHQPGGLASLRAVLARPELVAFSLCGAMFYLANGAMLGLVGQRLSRLVPEFGITLTAACAIVAQTVMVPTAFLAGAHADK